MIVAGGTVLVAGFSLAFGSVVESGVASAICQIPVSVIAAGEDLDLKNKSQAPCVLKVDMARHYNVVGQVGFVVRSSSPVLEMSAVALFAEIKAGRTVFPADRLDSCLAGMHGNLLSSGARLAAEAQKNNLDSVVVYCSERIGA